MPGSGSVAKSICFVGIENLLVLAPEYKSHGIGGAQLQQVLLAKALSRRGFKVSMVVADYGQPDGAVWDNVSTRKSYRMDAGIPGLRLIYPRATSIWAAMMRANADIYYSSCADYLPGLLCMFARVHGRKTVHRIAHDTDCQPDKLLIPNRRSIALYKYGIKRVDLILAQSQTQQADMLKNFGRHSKVVPSLVELGSSSATFHTRDIQVLWVGNMRPFKRPQLFLDLVASLPDVSFLMVGGEDPRAPELYRELEARAEQMPNVKFAGPMSYADVEAHMGRTTIFVNTSVSEGFPNTFMQAWTRGTPVVTLFDPDNVVERHELGRAVKNLEEMRDAIREFLSGESLWNRVSAQCINYASDRHGASAVDAYVEALRAL